MKTSVGVAALAAVVLLTSACGAGPLGRGGAGASAGEPACLDHGAATLTCEVPGYPDRPAEVHVPAGRDGEPLPVVIFLHGGGGNATNVQATTCPGGDGSDPGCLSAVGDAEGFITVFPHGYRPSTLTPLRTWNAGGGTEYACASGAACRDGSDDVAYLEAVIDQVENDFAVDPARIYVMGFSNGAAMAHRVACVLSDSVAAIVAVSGANEIGADGGCSPSRPVAVMHVHGTADACWTYETSRRACADFDRLPKAGVAESTAAWVEALRCETEPAVSAMPDAAPDDGTTTTVQTYSGCDGGVEVRILTVDGGGHVYPQGAKVREPRDREDLATQDFGNAEFWAWLSRWSLADA